MSNSTNAIFLISCICGLDITWSKLTQSAAQGRLNSLFYFGSVTLSVDQAHLIIGPDCDQLFSEGKLLVVLFILLLDCFLSDFSNVQGALKLFWYLNLNIDRKIYTCV